MKSLREYTMNLHKTDRDGEPETGITWGGAFTPPIHGVVNGLPVRILQTGDLPGASTVLLCADPTGVLAPVQRRDVIVTDGTYLPLRDTTPQTFNAGAGSAMR
jgi:hypothetical protein